MNRREAIKMLGILAASAALPALPSPASTDPRPYVGEAVCVIYWPEPDGTRQEATYIIGVDVAEGLSQTMIAVFRACEL